MSIRGIILAGIFGCAILSNAARAQTITIPGWQVPMTFVNMAHCNGHKFNDSEFCNLIGDVNYFDWTPQQKAFVTSQFEIAAKAQHLKPLQSMVMSKSDHLVHIVLV